MKLVQKTQSLDCLWMFMEFVSDFYPGMISLVFQTEDTVVG